MCGVESGLEIDVAGFASWDSWIESMVVLGVNVGCVFMHPWENRMHSISAVMIP